MKKPLAIGLLTFTLTVVSFIALISFVLSYREEITNFALTYPLFIPVLIVIWRAISIVIAPLPGGILSFAFIPILGWFWAWLYGSFGVAIGATIAFYIARKFREPAVSRFIPLKKLHAWEEKLSERTEFLAFVGVRITTGPIMDFISYVAGLSKISYKKFILATIVAQVPEAIWYYLGGSVYQKLLSTKSVLGGTFLVAILVIGFFVVRNHGIFKKKEI
ncbi:MAG: TVP38/TMEM64 family protein [Candidatus Levybacteria bacterium]|nr:TVP38/TMEM64 family protein [Candidatus Levybacteria bacterium]MBI2420805.1 TVP38/TMEM64 family protein [Candidatus Levybacteria bacterium]MBI4097642.1 TVP38/TMEM64 family protein [Candidatus Levybacteria bacterium]